jgi:hypothetical protein
MCIQMTQATILNAKKEEGRKLSVSFKRLVLMLVQLEL